MAYDPDPDYTLASRNLDSLPFPVFDGSGCRLIDLGPDVYALLDYDGEYRVGIYYNLPEDEGAVMATFARFEDVRAFTTRLASARAPLPKED